MRLRERTHRQRVAAPIEDVFQFCERAENLARITPRSLQFQVLTPAPVVMQQGRIIDYRIRLAGIGVAWRSEIPVYCPNSRFVDRQVCGPFALWHHVHRFEADGQHTFIVDRVRYVLPLWLPASLERLVHRAWVGPYLERIFDYRERVFSQIFDQRCSH